MISKYQTNIGMSQNKNQITVFKTMKMYSKKLKFKLYAVIIGLDGIRLDL